MSPVLDIQRRMRTLGKIRMGDKGGRGQPQRLTEFRITSPSRQLVLAVASLYGGECREWKGAPDGEQWEVYTKTAQLPIAIPPSAEPYSQWYELWSAAGCTRRCDGVTATVATESQGMRERSCVCDADNRECKLTTRASVMLPDVPGVGVWTLESHGYNAAVEMTGALQLLGQAASQGVFIEAVLRLEQRSKRVPGQPVSRFVVPVIDLPELTVGQLMAGGASLPSATPVAAPSGRPALPSGAPALPATTGMAIDPGQDERPPTPEPPSGDAPADEPGWGTTPTPPSGEAARRSASSAGNDTRPITQPQRKRMWAIAKSAGAGEDRVRELVKKHTGQESTEAIERWQYELICAELEGGGQ